MHTAALLILLAGTLAAEPSLLANRADFTRLKTLAARNADARAALDDLRRFAEDWPAAHVKRFGLGAWDVPPEGAGWSHAYACPTHGVRLQGKGRQNLCPVDGRDFHGWPYDNVAYMHRNSDNAAAARDLGLAFHLDGQPAFAAKARRILLAYAALYPKLPNHDNNNKDTPRGARVMSQTLSEAHWIVPLAFAYDLVRDTLAPADRAVIERDLLRPAAQVIAKNDAKASNWQTWHNAALLAIGLAVNDRALVDLAVDGPSGFRFQTRASITSDGPWYEGAWGYHFYALGPLLQTAEMATRAGLPLPELKAVKAMLDAPANAAFPDGTLPAFNDSGIVQLASQSTLFAIGLRLWGDPAHARYAKHEGAGGLLGWLWGAAGIPPPAPPPQRSLLMRGAGYATLRAPGSDFTAAFKFGPHGGGHGHYDKLNFVTFANGRYHAHDPGTQAYAAPTHATWDKETVAHNTVVVDGRSQQAATGELLEWRTAPRYTRITASAGDAYPGVALRRTLVLAPRFLLDVFTVKAVDGRERQIDWVYHNEGALAVPPGLEPYAGLPRGAGYQHLTKARALATGADAALTFTQPGSSMRLLVLGANGSTVVAAEGLGLDLRRPVPLVMIRRRAMETRFVALYEPFTGAPQVRGVEETAPGQFVVRFQDGAEETVDTVPSPATTP